jgi:hypothetical protein
MTIETGNTGASLKKSRAKFSTKTRPRNSHNSKRDFISRSDLVQFFFLFDLRYPAPLPHFNEAGELPGDRTPVQPQVLQALTPPGYKPLGLIWFNFVNNKTIEQDSQALHL